MKQKFTTFFWGKDKGSYLNSQRYCSISPLAITIHKIQRWLLFQSKPNHNLLKTTEPSGKAVQPSIQNL